MTPEEISWQFVLACRNGDVKQAEKMLELDSKNRIDLDNGMLVATSWNQENVVNLLLEKGANNLDSCLRTAVERNYYGLSELFVKKGADPIIGIRISKSPNITTMLYRYDKNRNKNTQLIK